MEAALSQNRTQIDFIFVPPWVYSGVKTSGEMHSSVLNVDKLFDIVSAQDVASVVVLNEVMSKLIGDVSCVQELAYHWNKSSIFLHSVEPLVVLTQSVVTDRLFDVSLKGSDQANAFSIIELSKDVFGVVINAGFFCGDSLNQDVRSLQKELLDRLYSRETSDRVALRPVFESYILGMSVQA